MLPINVGQVATLTIGYLDQNGQPMLTPPVPDSPPVWTDTPATPPVDTFTQSADGSTATLTALGPGSDTVGVTVVVGGVSYEATLGVQISGQAAQVLTSIVINSSVQ